MPISVAWDRPARWRPRLLPPGTEATTLYMVAVPRLPG
jgi:hypothetical protein